MKICERRVCEEPVIPWLSPRYCSRSCERKDRRDETLRQQFEAGTPTEPEFRAGIGLANSSAPQVAAATATDVDQSGIVRGHTPEFVIVDETADWQRAQPRRGRLVRWFRWAR